MGLDFFIHVITYACKLILGTCRMFNAETANVTPCLVNETYNSGLCARSVRALMVALVTDRAVSVSVCTGLGHAVLRAMPRDDAPPVPDRNPAESHEPVPAFRHCVTTRFGPV